MKNPLKQIATSLSVLALLLTVLPAPTAHAAFPGLNGRVVFQSNQDGDFEIYTMKLDGSDVRQLTNNAAADGEPAWSPDGTKVLFSSTRDTGSNAQIYVMDADGGNVQRLTTSSGADARARYTPSSNKIAFQSTRDHAQPEIYTMDADGSNVLRLTTNTVQDAEPTYLSETVIIFASRRDGNKEVYSMNQDGSNPINLTNYASPGSGDDNTPIASLSGDSIFFSTARNHSIGQVYRMDINGANQTKLTNRSASTSAAFMAPEKDMITFQDTEGGDFEIARMDPDGSGIAVLTNNAFSDLYPSIQPLTIEPSTINQDVLLDATDGEAVTYDTVSNHTDTYEAIDPTSVTIITEPDKGSIEINNTTGAITYTPDSNDQAKANTSHTPFSTLATSFSSFLSKLISTPAHAQTPNQDSFTYQICSTANSELCTENTVAVSLASTVTSSSDLLAETGYNTSGLMTLSLVILMLATTVSIIRRRLYV